MAILYSILVVLLYLEDSPTIKAGCKRCLEHHFGGAGGKGSVKRSHLWNEVGEHRSPCLVLSYMSSFWDQTLEICKPWFQFSNHIKRHAKNICFVPLEACVSQRQKMSHLVSPKLVSLSLIFLHPNKQVGRLVPEVLPPNPDSHHRSGNHAKCFLYIRTRKVTVKSTNPVEVPSALIEVYNSGLLLSFFMGRHYVHPAFCWQWSNCPQGSHWFHRWGYISPKLRHSLTRYCTV